MSLVTTTHLNFGAGEARPALEHYHRVFGGELALTSYRELGMPADAPDAEKIVFGAVTSPDGFRVMAYDVPGGAGPVAASPTATRREHGATLTERPFFVSLRADSLDAAQRAWDGLADGATVIEPLAASAWSPGFGMLADRFGVTWVIDVAG
ncbi:VOC family protein [Agromyces mediolanus]|uniref:VOC family protein n=1 Tax=Agromyces mediolanus TaxID=41986 RepID=UPI003834425C